MTDELAVNATYTTPRSWPEGAIPTADQLADWLQDCTRDERVALCDRMLASQELASRCFMQDHERLLAEVEALRQRVVAAYEEGWNAAADKAMEAIGE